MSLKLEMTRYTRWFNLWDCHFESPFCADFLQHRPAVSRRESRSLLLSHSWPTFTATRFTTGLRSEILWLIWVLQWISPSPATMLHLVKTNEKNTICKIIKKTNRNQNPKQNNFQYVKSTKNYDQYIMIQFIISRCQRIYHTLKSMETYRQKQLASFPVSAPIIKKWDTSFKLEVCLGKAGLGTTSLVICSIKQVIIYTTSQAVKVGS